MPPVSFRTRWRRLRPYEGGLPGIRLRRSCLDLRFPKMKSGLQWLKEVRREGHPHPVALISGDVSSLEVTKEMVNLGLTARRCSNLSPYGRTSGSADAPGTRTFNPGDPNPIPVHPGACFSTSGGLERYEMVLLLQLAVDVWLRDGRGVRIHWPWTAAVGP